MKPHIVASTRPELIKLAPVMREFDKKGIEYKFVTTGRPMHTFHYIARQKRGFSYRHVPIKAE